MKKSASDRRRCTAASYRPADDESSRRPCAAAWDRWRFWLPALSMTVRRPPTLTLPHIMGEGEGGGPRGEPADRRLVVAADRRLQQKRS